MAQVGEASNQGHESEGIDTMINITGESDQFVNGASKSQVKYDPMHKVDNVVVDTDTILKESENGNALNQQRSTNSRTTLPPENVGFVNAPKKEVDPEATQASKKRRWKPNSLNKPEEGYDYDWLSGERRSKGRILFKACWKNTKKRSSCSPKCEISKKNVSARYRDKRPWSSVEESGAEALGSVSISEQSNFPKTSKEKRKRKNSPSQEEDSADKVGEELVGCRVRVWWPLDQVFYEGHITLFDHSEKKHKVIYEDGDQEMLNLTKERWELVEDDNASVPALNVDDDVPVLTPVTESKQIVCSRAKLCRKIWQGKEPDDPTPPLTMTMQQNLTPKGVHQNKGINVEASESGLEGNPTPIKVSPEDGDVCSEVADVHGYKVKVSSAPILAAIFAKYGDITVNCRYKSPIVRASLLDVVSDVVRRLKTSDVNSSSIEAMKTVVSDVADTKLDVTWLQQYLDEIFEEEDMEEKYSYLMALSETTMLVSTAAKKDLVERNREVLAAEKRLKKAERRLQEAKSQAGDAERSVNVFDVLGKKVQQDIKETKDQARYWRSRLNELQ
ncbi:sister chromatid cohesion protein PDS5 homolog C-like [Lycium barbarum]|uniref:sister chromatid cohesion protein PDS5 homolog C-like n=1 Tax=Lycium barbarum TaxID=112863 RepID=UPI00293E7035|nr:sister chromatid cohesion protein PDS5 homolog C-like [Lycium barbarum]XP_060171103.1 sister chromatid cohesion protein PDS5 homolog C-like [Lycium barbarum]XP_060171104.1 sister chromatid cohesion protein PDS5 homolog C-like [Lycium barbarum]